MFILLCAGCFAQTTFEQANSAYADGNFALAAELYDSLLVVAPSAEVYYNLGNAYFRQGEIAKSILNYERALRLKPNYKDARYNLAFAQNQIVDNIEDNSSFFVSQWIKSLRNLFSERTWQILSLAFFLIVLIATFLFAFASSTAWRKIGFHTAWVMLLCAVLSVSFTASLHNRDVNREEAIVMQGIVNVKASPDRSGTDLFTLHEGTKVYVKSTVGDWAEITVGNNKGWIKLSNIERI